VSEPRVRQVRANWSSDSNAADHDIVTSTAGLSSDPESRIQFQAVSRVTQVVGSSAKPDAVSGANTQLFFCGALKRPD